MSAPVSLDVYMTLHSEDVLLPYWLRHYETLATRIFVWADDPTPLTAELLHTHPLVTLQPLTLHGIDDIHWVQGIWPLYRTLSRTHTDWVAIVDADEFLVHPDLPAELARHRAAAHPILATEGWNMVAEAPPTGSGQIYDELRHGLRGNAFQDKPCIFDPTANVRFAPGRHFLAVPPTPPTPTPIKLLHYRYLGDAYMADRSARNLARTSASNIRHKYHKVNKPGSPHPYATQRYRDHRHEAVDVMSQP